MDGRRVRAGFRGPEQGPGTPPPEDKATKEGDSVPHTLGRTLCGSQGGVGEGRDRTQGSWPDRWAIFTQIPYVCEVSACAAIFVPISQLRRSRLRESK